jgi:2-iminoacetate synthase ThiH
MDVGKLISKALNREPLTIDEGAYLFRSASLGELMATGHRLRQLQVPGNRVTWIIDRNSNTTNVCVANCKFCNFYRVPGHADAYITSLEQYKTKIEELFRFGGEQLLLQGGHHPDLGLDYYSRLFRDLKQLFPQLKLQHLVRIRQVQEEKPPGAIGFLAFIPWPFQDEGTLLQRLRRAENNTTSEEYIRMIALSRIMLPNIRNIQASWLTVGKATAQLCLHAGANDMGSIMIEENVVSAAGAPHRFTAQGIQQAIREAGYEPQLRNQQYEYRMLPEAIEQQIIESKNLIVN